MKNLKTFENFTNEKLDNKDLEKEKTAGSGRYNFLLKQLSKKRSELEKETKEDKKEILKEEISDLELRIKTIEKSGQSWLTKKNN